MMLTTKLLLKICLLTSASCGLLDGCSSPQAEYLEISTPTPLNDGNESKRYTEFINKEGWHVPLPPESKNGPKNMIRSTSASGSEVDVVVIVMVNFKNYRFTYGTMNEEQKNYLGEGELKLVALKELRVGRNVFAYVIMAETIDNGMKMSGNEPHQHPFLYRIFDRDGDGKFETLFPGDSDNFVPEWACKNTK